MICQHLPFFWFLQPGYFSSTTSTDSLILVVGVFFTNAFTVTVPQCRARQISIYLGFVCNDDTVPVLFNKNLFMLILWKCCAV